MTWRTATFAVVAFVVIGAAGLWAQSRDTGVVLGSVMDASGAVVPDAEVELRDAATNVAQRTRAGASGQYTFSAVLPGDYVVIVTAPGFRQTVLSGVQVTVGRSTLANAVLQLGDLTQRVEVTSGAVAELQTVDSAVGEVVGGTVLTRLPTIQRNSLELVYLQVGTTPALGTSGQYYGRGGSVGGASGDQNTATLDGVDITERYTSASRGISSIDLPVDAIEEFRSTTANPNAAMGGTSSGGTFAFTTRRGGNSFHGAAYAYHQNDNLNANSWTRNRLRQKSPELKDNRFGGRVGGPIFKDRTFFFAFYEGRRLPQSTDAVRIVPSDTFRRGILRFVDGSGAVVNYDLANSRFCGAGSNGACDPRGLGMSPLIQQYMGLYPAGNDPSSGDGLNTLGFRAPADISSSSDTSVLRLDHNFTANWRFGGSFVYQRQRFQDTGQLELDTTVTNGGLRTLSGSPRDPRNVVLSLTGLLSPRLTNDVRLGWNRQDFGTKADLPRIQLSALRVPLDLAGTLLDDPGDPVISRARPQSVRERNWSFTDSLNWIAGSHALQFGISTERRVFFNNRPDRTSVNTSPVARITAGESVTIPAAQRPPTCSGTQANCLRSADVSRWNTLYGAALGLWDNTQMIAVRDAQGNVAGSAFLSNDDISWHTEIRAMDTWRLGQSLTFNYGLNVLLETPWSDKQGREFFIVDAGSRALIRPMELLKQKSAAAAEGRPLNVPIAYVPRDTLKRGIYSDIARAAPRAGVAWNPAFSDGILGKLFGERKTVFRGGYSVLYSRIMATLTVTTQINSNELLASSASILAPQCNAAGTPGPGCSSGAPFRVGVDGTPFAPAPTGSITIPFVPAARQTTTPGSRFGVVSARGIDPGLEPGRVHGADFTVQREFRGNTIVELGWMGRWGRNLVQSVNLNAVPAHLTDMSGQSRQTFAQAFDAVATQLRGGTAPAAVTPQPWFENVFGASQTRAIATAAASNFVSGGLTPLFQNTLDPRLQALGRPTVQNQQFDRLMYLTNGGWSNYQAFFVSTRKQISRGLSVAGNWTWSHALDTGGAIFDNNGGALTDPFNPSFDYADAITDVRHVVKAYGTYDLPLPARNRLLGGWQTSFIFVARTGLPVAVAQGGDIFGAPPVLGPATESAPGVTSRSERAGRHSSVAGSGGVATSGDPARGGTGLNLFSNPQAVFNSFRPFLISQDRRSGRGAVRGLGLWNLDFSVAKRTALTEKLGVSFTADFFNLFNHPSFNDPALSLLSPASFGVISAQAVGNPARADFAGPRRVQFGLRLEF